MQTIKKLYIEPSSCCNLNCRMCFRNNWFEEHPAVMSEQTSSKVLEILNSDLYDSVFFGGMGEPLMHKAVFSMIKAAASRGKPTELITNATLLDSQKIAQLKSSGLHRLWVSVDGFSKESYESVRLGSLYERIIRNLETFCREKGGGQARRHVCDDEGKSA